MFLVVVGRGSMKISMCLGVCMWVGVCVCVCVCVWVGEREREGLLSVAKTDDYHQMLVGCQPENFAGFKNYRGQQKITEHILQAMSSVMQMLFCRSTGIQYGKHYPV